MDGNMGCLPPIVTFVIGQAIERSATATRDRVREDRRGPLQN